MTDDEIAKVLGFNEFTPDPTKVMLTQVANAIIAAYQTKLLAGVEMPEVTRFDIDMDGSMEPHEDGAWVRAEVFFDQLQQYAAACAAQAREKALEDAKGVCESHWSVEGIAQRCYDDIDRLKGGE